MASEQKTQRFGLNQWAGEDKPKRADFNADNLAIESALAAVADTVAEALEEVHNAIDGVGTASDSLPRDSTENGVRVLRDVARKYVEQTATGAIKITLPQSWSSLVWSIAISGFNYRGPTGSPPTAFELLVSGLDYEATQSWTWTSASCLSGNMPDGNDMIRFGHDGTNCCIVIGDLSSAWSFPYFSISEVLFPQNTGADSLDGWSIELVTDLSGIVFSGGTLYANTPTPSIAHPTWYNAAYQNGFSGTVQYCKIGGVVYARGYFVNSALVSYTPVFRLPAGYRPGPSVYLPIPMWRAEVSSLDAEVFADYNGDVTIRSYGAQIAANSRVYIAASFVAEQ